MEVVIMDTRVALIGIVISDISSVREVNELLHSNGEYIIGRMGIPYKTKKINIISVAIDAPNDIISTLAGKLGQLEGVSTKVLYND
jgi:putative iron-only hydrogenase system regulator